MNATDVTANELAAIEAALARGDREAAQAVVDAIERLGRAQAALEAAVARALSDR